MPRLLRRTQTGVVARLKARRRLVDVPCGLQPCPQLLPRCPRLRRSVGFRSRSLQPGEDAAPALLIKASGRAFASRVVQALLQQFVQEAAHEPLVHEGGHLGVAKWRMTALLGVALAELDCEVVRHSLQSLFHLLACPIANILGGANATKAFDRPANDDASGVGDAALDHLCDLRSPGAAAEILQVETIRLLVLAEGHPDRLLCHSEQSQGPIASLPVQGSTGAPHDLSCPLTSVSSELRLEEAPQIQSFGAMTPAAILALPVEQGLRIDDVATD
mmetsp:Transcript_55831/g.161715  ORF Transcript_55831/g.161715 Transcript_55831/m.161715 type:complete len:275 (+) Transcript_55831:708-1532(+)